MKRLTRREVLAAPAALAAQQPRPNLVFLFSDDHHYQCLGAAGNPHIHTPNLDRLAARGTLFASGIVSTPQCCPSRGIMSSGLEIYQSGLESNGRKDFRPNLGPTVIEQLSSAGYETTQIGKWHIDRPQAAVGFQKAPLWLRGGSSPYRDPELRRGFVDRGEKIPGHITDLFTDAAIDYVRGATRPYFLWLSYNAPHTPWFAADRYRARYAGKSSLAPPNHPPGGRDFDWVTYYSVITHLDEAIGRLLAALDGNTVVFFVGDNGFMCGTKNWNGKVVPWEESIRVPFIAAGGPFAKGGRSDAPVASVDVPATWLDLAGVRPKSPLAGRSLVKAAGFDAAFASWTDGRPEALAVKQRVEPYRVVRTRTHKYILWESGKQAVYDWRADPGEEKDLSADASLLSPLREKLAARIHSTADQQARAW
ncbi:MAG: sulfatase family protein [Bryobacteraceae bacterium]